MNARDVIVQALTRDGLACCDECVQAPDSVWQQDVDAILAALGCDDGPVAITSPDKPVRRLERNEFGWFLGPEVGES